MFITTRVQETNSTDAQQKNLCVSPVIQTEEVLPSILPRLLCQFFWCRLCSALMKKTEIHEWRLFWAQAFDGHSGREKVGKLAGDLTPLCLLDHKKGIFGKLLVSSALFHGCKDAFAASVNFMSNNQTIKWLDIHVFIVVGYWISDRFHLKPFKRG